MPKSEIGKLFISYPNHKLHFSFKLYQNDKTYNQYLVSESKSGYRQTPIISLRLIAIMQSLFKSGYWLVNMKSHDVPKYLSDFTKEPYQNKSYPRFIKDLNRLDDTNYQAEISSVLFKKCDSFVVVRNNGIISVDTPHYQSIAKMIADLLNSIEM